MKTLKELELEFELWNTRQELASLRSEYWRDKTTQAMQQSIVIAKELQTLKEQENGTPSS